MQSIQKELTMIGLLNQIFDHDFLAFSGWAALWGGGRFWGRHLLLLLLLLMLLLMQLLNVLRHHARWSRAKHRHGLRHMRLWINQIIIFIASHAAHCATHSKILRHEALGSWQIWRWTHVVWYRMIRGWDVFAQNAFGVFENIGRECGCCICCWKCINLFVII